MKNNEKVRGIAKTNMEVGKLQKRWKKIELGLVAVGLCLALLLTAAIPVCEARPDEKVVKVGLAPGYLGPLATIGTPCFNAQFDYFRYINEQGGINGIKIETLWRETKGMVPDNCFALRRLAPEGIVIFHEIGISEALLIVAQRVEIPVISVDAVSAEGLARPQWFVGAISGWDSGIVTMTKWFKEEVWAEARPLRLGLLVEDFLSGHKIVNFCTQNRKYFEKMGVEIVGHEFLPLTCIDSTTEWLRLVNKRADLIWFNGYGMVTVTAVKDSTRLEIQQKGITLMATPQTLDETALVVVKKDAEGWYNPTIFPLPSDPDMRERFPGLKILAEKEKEYRGIEPEELTGWSAYGWVMSATSVEAIRVAIEKVGYENLTGRAVRDALFGGDIRNFGADCYLTRETIDEDHPYLGSHLYVYQVREGKTQYITELECVQSFYISPEEFERGLGL